MRGWSVLAAGLSAVVATTAVGVAGAAEPTFVNGLAQNVFSANTADWIRGEGWVESTFDTDGDGKRTASTSTSRGRRRPRPTV